MGFMTSLCNVCVYWRWRKMKVCSLLYQLLTTIRFWSKNVYLDEVINVMKMCCTSFKHNQVTILSAFQPGWQPINFISLLSQMEKRIQWYKSGIFEYLQVAKPVAKHEGVKTIWRKRNQGLYQHDYSQRASLLEVVNALKMMTVQVNI